VGAGWGLLRVGMALGAALKALMAAGERGSQMTIYKSASATAVFTRSFSFDKKRF
jgi:hypothetical protein